MKEARKMILGAYPSWECRSLESIYNCMGLVFANRRTAIEPEYFDMIVSDDGYKKLSTLEEAIIGDVFAFRDRDNLIAHVGILLEKSKIGSSTIMKILSQWGKDGEYVHSYDQWPKGIDIHGGIQSIEAWTQRTGVSYE